MTTTAKNKRINNNFKLANSKLLHQIGKAIDKYNLIENNDCILVAFSGGKDSWTMLHLLEQLRKKAPIKFTLKIVTVHPGFKGFQTKVIEKYLEKAGFNYLVKKHPW